MDSTVVGNVKQRFLGTEHLPMTVHSCNHSSQ